MNNILSIFARKREEKTRIGSGSYAIVYRGYWKKRLCAIKEIKLEDDINEEEEAEILALQRLNHLNIVKYFGHEKDQITKIMSIYMEFLPFGNLSEFIKSRKARITEHEAKVICKQLLIAVEYLHSKNVIHRDIKPENVFMASNQAIKLGDFGISKIFWKESRATTVIGTAQYMAPEVLEGEYGRKADIWSVGCVTLEMVTGVPPWHNVKLRNQIFLKLAQNKSPVIPDDIGGDTKIFLEAVFKPENERPLADEVLSMSWLQNVKVPDPSPVFSPPIPEALLQRVVKCVASTSVRFVKQNALKLVLFLLVYLFAVYGLLCMDAPRPCHQLSIYECIIFKESVYVKIYKWQKKFEDNETDSLEDFDKLVSLNGKSINLQDVYKMARHHYITQKQYLSSLLFYFASYDLYLECKGNGCVLPDIKCSVVFIMLQNIQEVIQIQEMDDLFNKAVNISDELFLRHHLSPEKYIKCLYILSSYYRDKVLKSKFLEEVLEKMTKVSPEDQFPLDLYIDITKMVYSLYLDNSKISKARNLMNNTKTIVSKIQPIDSRIDEFLEFADEAIGSLDNLSKYKNKNSLKSAKNKETMNEIVKLYQTAWKQTKMIDDMFEN